jgi:hypothetical protein
VPSARGRRTRTPPRRKSDIEEATTSRVESGDRATSRSRKRRCHRVLADVGSDLVHRLADADRGREVHDPLDAVERAVDELAVPTLP